MTTQFLILRIQAVLEGKAELEASQMRAIAGEYKRLCEDAERRLVHCAALIRAGRDHMALQVAETEPLLLESINELSFPQLDEWHAYCKSNSLPFPPHFNETQISLTKSLYTREISETHPLYRDYRRAMRMHKYEDALTILKTISKVNATNAAAKHECERLRKRIVIDKFYRAKDAWLEKRENDALELAKEIRDDADLIIHDVVWRTMAERLDNFEKEISQKRISEIIPELKALEHSDDYQKILALGAEIDVLANKYSIKISDSDLSFIKTLMDRAGSIQEKEIEREAKVAALRALTAEISSTIKRDPSKRLKEIEDLKKRAGDILDKETLHKLSPVVYKLKAQILTAITLKISAAAAILVLTAYIGNSWYASAKQRLLENDASALLSSMRNSATLKDMTERYALFIEKYDDLAKNEKFRNDIENFSRSIEDLTSRKARIDANFKKLDLLDAASANPKDWENAFIAIDQMRSDAEKFFKYEQDYYLERINEKATALGAQRNEQRAKITQALDKLLADAEKVLNNPDILSKDFGNSLAKAGTSIAEARKIIDSPSLVFTASESDIGKIEGLDASLKSAMRDMEAISIILEDLEKAKTTDDYFELLQELAELKGIGATHKKILDAVLEKEDAILFNIYGGMVDPKIAAKTPEKFSPFEIDFSNDEIAGRIFKHSDGNKNIYTDGKLSVRQQSWKGGSEIIQEAAEIAPNGTTTKVIYRLNQSDGMRARGSILVEGSISEESNTARNAADISSTTSPLNAIRFVANADCSPVFKVWLESKLLETMRKDPISSGLAFSDSLNARAKTIDNLSRELSAMSWIYATPSRANLIKSELYSKNIPDYYEEANNRAQEIRRAYKNPMKLVGYVPMSGPFKISSFAPPIYGLNASGNFSQVKDGEAAKFSPLFRTF